MFHSVLFVVFISMINAKQKPYFNHYKNIHKDFTTQSYQPYYKIEEELKRVSEIGNENIMKTLFVIGKTFEERNLWAIKIHKLDKELNKKTIVIDCGAHAREWVAPATCMYMIEQFNSGRCNDVLDKFDYVIIPVLNPDGYVYTWKNNKTRMWRKNRSYSKSQMEIYNKTKNELCIGTDINRNFDEKWGGVGAPIIDPCYEMYAGSGSFSEKESTALANYLNSTKSNIIAYVSLHTYGQSWMTPFGFTKERPKAYKELRRVALIAVETMRNFSGVKYTVGPSHDQLYPNSGSSVDWVYKTLKIPYTYLIEMMPGTGSKVASFLAPPSVMQRNSKDLIEGIKAMSVNLNTKLLNL